MQTEPLVDSKAHRGSFARWIIWILLSGVLTVPALVQLGWIAPPPLLCMFKESTGVGCPGCGLSRSIYALSRADFSESIRLHLFGPLIALLVVGMWVHYGWSLFTGRDLISTSNRAFLYSVIVLWTLLILYWIARLAMGAIP
jgi:hypothetical protein